MQDAPHIALERIIDHLVLLNARLAAKTLGDDFRGIVITIACQIANGHLRVRNRVLDHFLDVARVHSHVLSPKLSPV
ncbi:hypothetical protein NZA98_01190, partial [Escherichia coli]|nr:hypothetical protein [Escherichia coli]